jgi:hypothetical protein
MSVNIPEVKPTTKVAEVNRMLEELRRANCHVLPAALPIKIDRIPESHQICFFPKLFDPNPGGRDCYRDNRFPQGHVALRSSALVQLWNAAGGRCVLSMQIDDGSKGPLYVEWKYIGEYREIGGAWIPKENCKRIDLREGSSQIANWKDGQIMQQRANIYETAEQKAMSRVIRKSLGIESSYHQDEYAFPFVVVRPVLVPNMKDKLTRMIYILDSIGATRAAFGPETLKQLMSSASFSEVDDSDDDEPPELPAGPAPKSLAERNDGRSPAAPAPAETSARVEARSNVQIPTGLPQTLAEFEKILPDDQVAVLEKLAKLKAYDCSTLMKPIKAFKPEHRVQFFNKLAAMADAPDALPF